MTLTKNDLKEALLEERKHTQELFVQERKYTEKLFIKERKHTQELFVQERKHTEKIMDRKLDNHRDKLLEYMKVRFDELQTQINDIKCELQMTSGCLSRLENKIDQIKKMESEDIKDAYEEIEKMKKRISFIENKLTMLKK